MRSLRALPTPLPSVSLHDAVASHQWAFTFNELVGLSSARRARTEISRGTVVRLLPDCYVAAEHVESFRARADAALMWCGERAALAGTSALFVCGVLDEPPDVLTVVVPSSRNLGATPDWLRVIRASYDYQTATQGRLSTVLPAVGLVQGYGSIDPYHRAATVYSALSRGVASVEDVVAALELVPRVPHRRQLVRRLVAASRGAQSYLEERGLADVFNTREFDRCVRQHRVTCQGRSYRLDMFDPVTKTAIELDGAKWHVDPAARQRDLQRDLDLAALGIQTIRLSFEDVVARPQECRERVLAVLRVREGSLAKRH